MPPVPHWPPTRVVKALERADFKEPENGPKGKGSHKVLKNKGLKRTAVVPIHRKDVPPGTLRNILKQTGLTVDQLQALDRGEDVPGITTAKERDPREGVSDASRITKPESPPKANHRPMQRRHGRKRGRARARDG
jgi:predicted RNA binding protein YcfA (HicA-like mRNA interferase family)